MNEIPRHHPERLGILLNYWNKLHAKWTFTKDSEDIKATVDRSQEVVVSFFEQRNPPAMYQEAIFKS